MQASNQARFAQVAAQSFLLIADAAGDMAKPIVSENEVAEFAGVKSKSRFGLKTGKRREPNQRTLQMLPWDKII